MRQMTIRQTDDGCNTIYLPEMDEHYHSTKGALTEARHIFIGMGFDHCTKPAPRVIEFGFGTGLNALLTALRAEETSRPTTYIALDNNPLPAGIADAMGYADGMGGEGRRIFQALHQAEWGRSASISPHFTLRKIKCDFTCPAEWQDGTRCDIVYFDAFAPDKQAGVWTSALFAAIHDSMAGGGLLVTYCAKGSVRRDLQTAGFTVERLPGPPGGKREILRATRPAATTSETTVNKEQ